MDLAQGLRSVQVGVRKSLRKSCYEIRESVSLLMLGRSGSIVSPFTSDSVAPSRHSIEDQYFLSSLIVQVQDKGSHHLPYVMSKHSESLECTLVSALGPCNRDENKTSQVTVVPNSFLPKRSVVTLGFTTSAD